MGKIAELKQGEIVCPKNETKVTQKTTNPTTAKPKDEVRSENGKIFLGMKVEEAMKSQEKMIVFNFADIDGDGVISQKELDRYNAPILKLVGEDVAGKITANASVHVGMRNACLGVRGTYSKFNSTEYYAGLTIRDVKPAGRETFTDIDLNSDGVISKEEITTAKKIIDKKKEITEEVKKAKSKANKHSGGKFKLGLSILAGIGSLYLVGFFGSMVLSGGLLPAAAAIFCGVVALLYGHGAYRYVGDIKAYPKAKKQFEDKQAELDKLQQGQEPNKEKTKRLWNMDVLTEVGRP